MAKDKVIEIIDYPQDQKRVKHQLTIRSVSKVNVGGKSKKPKPKSNKDPVAHMSDLHNMEKRINARMDNGFNTIKTDFNKRIGNVKTEITSIRKEFNDRIDEIKELIISSKK